MALTKAQEMVAENLRNGSIQAFAEGREVEWQSTVNPEIWSSMAAAENLLPDSYLYRVKRTPREWWEVRDEDCVQYTPKRFSSLADCVAWIGSARDLIPVHVREVIE